MVIFSILFNFSWTVIKLTSLLKFLLMYESLMTCWRTLIRWKLASASLPRPKRFWRLTTNRSCCRPSIKVSAVAPYCCSSDLISPWIASWSVSKWATLLMVRSCKKKQNVNHLCLEFFNSGELLFVTRRYCTMSITFYSIQMSSARANFPRYAYVLLLTKYVMCTVS